MSKNPSKDTFAFYCAAVDDVLSVELVNSTQLVEFFVPIVNQYVESKEKVNVNDYREHVVSSFVPAWADVRETISATTRTELAVNEIYSYAVRDVYSYITELYPDLSLQSLLLNINMNRTRSNMGEYLESIYDAGDEVEDEPEVSAVAETARVIKKPKPKRKQLTMAEVLDKLHKDLNKNVIGQEEAVASVLDAIKLTVTGIAPSSSLFFIGPTGCGKTRLAKVLGKLQYGDRFAKFNCSEYATAHEYIKLIGAPPGYVGHSDKSVLAEKAEKSNSWVFLFDEIEKAHHKFYDFLLSLLDDGRVTDANGSDLDFSRSIFIFTSNNGVKGQRIGETRVGFGQEVINYEESREVLKDSLKTHFNPEFLGRIDKVVVFNTLSKEDIYKVAKLELQDIPVKKTKELLSWIILEGYSKEYGARYLAKFIKNNIGVIVADAILNKVAPNKGNYYNCKLRDNKLYLVEMEKRI